MSNARRLPPRPPDETERGFRDELKRRGCPECGSRVVTGNYVAAADRWQFTLRCPGSCGTFTRPLGAFTAHATAAAAARGLGLAYTAFRGSSGGVVVAARGPQGFPPGRASHAVSRCTVIYQPGGAP